MIILVVNWRLKRQHQAVLQASTRCVHKLWQNYAYLPPAVFEFISHTGVRSNDGIAWHIYQSIRWNKHAWAHREQETDRKRCFVTPRSSMLRALFHYAGKRWRVRCSSAILSSYGIIVNITEKLHVVILMSDYIAWHLNMKNCENCRKLLNIKRTCLFSTAAF